MDMSRSVLMTSASLAELPDFTVGDIRVCPSSRTLDGPGGTIQVEPRVMQVLVVLADADGAVVTCDTLLNRCWGGVYVGDDSLNRAVAGVRRVASRIGGDSLEIETIPRTGYRLISRPSAPVEPRTFETAQECPQETRSSASEGVNRRAVLGAKFGRGGCCRRCPRSLEFTPCRTRPRRTTDGRKSHCHARRDSRD